MDTIKQGDLQLAPIGETPWNHSVNLRNGELTLYWQERNARGETEMHSRTVHKDTNMHRNKATVSFSF